LEDFAKKGPGDCCRQNSSGRKNGCERNKP
jgi:hypothetical protein